MSMQINTNWILTAKEQPPKHGYFFAILRFQTVSLTYIAQFDDSTGKYQLFKERFEEVTSQVILEELFAWQPFPEFSGSDQACLDAEQCVLYSSK